MDKGADKNLKRLFETYSVSKRNQKRLRNFMQLRDQMHDNSDTPMTTGNNKVTIPVYKRDDPIAQIVLDYVNLSFEV